MSVVKTLLALIVLTVLGLAAGCETSHAAGQRRVALVIGNSAYRDVGNLPNPIRDADAIAKALERLGFEVAHFENLDYDGMRRAVREFSDRSVGADIGLVYYAGHGIEMDKQNYLIPVDAKLRSDKDVELEAVPLDLVISVLDGNARLKLVLMDACRDNPFLKKMTRNVKVRSIGRGLAAPEPVEGMLVSYAASEGSTAADGDGEHSPYTQAVLDTIERPGIELNLLFRIVRDEVLRNTDNQQEPYFYASLPGVPVFLKAAVEETETKPPSAADDWDHIKTTESKSVLEAFIAAHAENRIYRSLAEERLAKLSATGNDAGTTQTLAPETECDRLAASPLDPRKIGSVMGVELSLIQPSALQACRNAVIDYPLETRFMHQLGRVLYKQRAYDEALQWYRKAADRDYVDAMTMMGVAYAEGRGAKQDFQLAMSWFRKAANLEYAVAVAFIGDLHHFGRGVPENQNEALAWYAKSATMGFVPAMTRIGRVYEQSSAPDGTKALEWYGKAAKLGDRDAMMAIGAMYQSGAVKGVAASAKKAIQWYQKAAELGDATAMTRIGILYQQGRGIKRDYRKAMSWYRKAAALNHPEAMRNIGLMYQSGLGVAKNQVEADKWLTQSGAARL